MNGVAAVHWPKFREPTVGIRELNCAHPPAGSLASMDPSPHSLQQAEQRKELSCGEGQKRLKSEEEEKTKGYDESQKVLLQT